MIMKDPSGDPSSVKVVLDVEEGFSSGVYTISFDNKCITRSLLFSKNRLSEEI